MNAFKTSLIATTIALALGAGAVSAQESSAAPERTLGQTVDDATITASVKAKLLADERTKGFDVNVDTVNGVVTMTGGADSSAAKSAAQELAGDVEGVILIKNELMVAAPGTEARQDANTATASGEVREALDESGDGIDDAWITSKVKTQLLADSAVKGTQITVETKGNMVTLAGTADTAEARAKAIEIATATKGVTHVMADDLMVKQ
ncbi:MAG: BON domain-containing protein [Arenimonas sp.]|uniref:BON domain-containing protein n=1 Tax=Arenimonas sp. TaxID=1872635 RepID=UPI0025C3CC81|nr:BON domain-containing protein [Arenimonas sp.]MBW8368965.1 BON domain-containing protein [Arenimonas sp.]